MKVYKKHKLAFFLNVINLLKTNAMRENNNEYEKLIAEGKINFIEKIKKKSTILNEKTETEEILENKKLNELNIMNNKLNKKLMEKYIKTISENNSKITDIKEFNINEFAKIKYILENNFYQLKSISKEIILNNERIDNIINKLPKIYDEESIFEKTKQEFKYLFCFIDGSYNNFKKLTIFNDFENEIKLMEEIYNLKSLMNLENLSVNMKNNLFSIKEKNLILLDIINNDEKYSLVKTNKNDYLPKYFADKKIDAFFQFTELYKNIYWFFINEIYKDKESLDSSIKDLILNSFNQKYYKEFFKKNKFIIEIPYSENLFKKLSSLNIKNINLFKYCCLGHKIEFTWDFENIDNLFETIKNLNLKEKTIPVLINNFGGDNITIINNNIVFNTYGNCTVHAFINFIVGILQNLDNNIILNIKVKNLIKEFIIQTLIDHISNIDVDKIHKEDYFKEHTFITKEMFDTSINSNIKDILSSDKKLVNFLIKFYDINVLLFKGYYNFTHNHQLVTINYLSDILIHFVFNTRNIDSAIDPNIDQDIIYIDFTYMHNKNLLGNLSSTKTHSNNIVYIPINKLENYKNFLKKLNNERPDNENIVTKNTFYNSCEPLSYSIKYNYNY